MSTKLRALLASAIEVTAAIPLSSPRFKLPTEKFVGIRSRPRLGASRQKLLSAFWPPRTLTNFVPTKMSTANLAALSKKQAYIHPANSSGEIANSNTLRRRESSDLICRMVVPPELLAQDRSEAKAMGSEPTCSAGRAQLA
jgi:hypothetical protein